MYLTCSDNGHGRCGNPYHKGSALRDGRCKYGRAWELDTMTRACPVCDEQLVPAHLGCVVHPEFLVALRNGAAAKPRLNAKDLPVLRGLFINPSARLCEPCGRLVATKVNAQTDHVGQVVVGKRLLPFIIANGEYRAALERIGDGPRRIAERVLEGRSTSKAMVREYEGRRQTRCIVHQLDEGSCLCGGWHDWRHMPAIVIDTDERQWAFPFGPACADAARSFVNFHTTYAEAIQAIQQSRRDAGKSADKPQPKSVKPKPSPVQYAGRHGTPDHIREKISYGGGSQRQRPRKGDAPRGNHPQTQEELEAAQAENRRRREAAREERRARTAARRAQRDKELAKRGQKSSDGSKKGKKKGKGRNAA